MNSSENLWDTRNTPVLTLGPRRFEAVKELEALQQSERRNAGEPALSTADFIHTLKDDLLSDLISTRLADGGIPAVVQSSDEDQARANRKYKELIDSWHLTDPSQWSRFENPGTRYHIAEYCSLIEAVFAKHKWHLPELPVVGTLTTGQVSACTQPSATQTPIILIDNGFFKFGGLISQLALFATQDLHTRGRFSEATLQLMSDIAGTQTILNSSLFVFRRQTPPQFEVVVANLVESFCLFVIAHEYAHILAGDLNMHPRTQDETGASLHAKEFAADKIGFTVAAEANQTTESVFGPFLYLAGLDLIDRASATFEGRPTPSATTDESEYPTPFERTMSLLQWIEESPFKQPHGEAVRAAAGCYNTILFVWDLVLPGFRQAVKDLSEFAQGAGPPTLQEYRTFGVVHTLWNYVRATLGRELGQSV